MGPLPAGAASTAQEHSLFFSVFLFFLSISFYFVSGHNYTVSGIQFSAAFVGYDEMHWITGSFVLLNLLWSHFLTLVALPLLTAAVGGERAAPRSATLRHMQSFKICYQ